MFNLEKIEDAKAFAGKMGIDSPPFLVGVRGYSNGGNNQRSIYDDAVFLCGADFVRCFRANCDPGIFADGVASLQSGVWWYRRGIHGLSKPVEKQYPALVQAAPVAVKRDGAGIEVGFFGINIHRGSRNSVSSLGCQTIYPDMWPAFMEFIDDVFEEFGIEKIPYILCNYEDLSSSGGPEPA